MMLSHEVISIGLILLVCISFSLFCVLIWLFRCRAVQRRSKEERHDRQKDIDIFKDNQFNKACSKRAVSDTVVQPKRAEVVEFETTTKDENNLNDSEKSLEQQIEQEYVPPKFEARHTQPYLPKQLERIKREASPTRHKRYDTVSMGSMISLQRNDSKVNVFPVEKMDDIDLNPGLNNVINLEMI